MDPLLNQMSMVELNPEILMRKMGSISPALTTKCHTSNCPKFLDQNGQHFALFSTQNLISRIPPKNTKKKRAAFRPLFNHRIKSWTKPRNYLEKWTALSPTLPCFDHKVSYIELPQKFLAKHRQHFALLSTQNLISRDQKMPGKWAAFRPLFEPKKS